GQTARPSKTLGPILCVQSASRHPLEGCDLKNVLRVVGTVLLMAVASYATVNVTSPTAGSSVPSSVHVTGNATMSGTIVATQVYVDGIKLYQTSSSGSHNLVLQSWNSAGQYLKSSGVNFSVSGTSASTGVTVSSPTPGSTVAAPVAVKASATMSGTVTTMQVYVDGNKLYQGSGSTVNTTLSNVGSGTHQLVV